MRWMAPALAVALLGAGCGDADSTATDATTTIPTVVTGATVETPEAREIFVPWHERATFDPIGQDPADCFTQRGDGTLGSGEPDDDIDVGPGDGLDSAPPDEPRTRLDRADSWFVVEGWSELVEDDLGVRVPTLNGRMVLHPASDFAPTHLVATEDSVRETLTWLQSQHDVSLIALFFLARDDLGLEPAEGEQLGEIATGWAVVGDQLVSFTDCASVEHFRSILAAADFGDPTTEDGFVEALTAMTASRQSVLDAMQVGSNSFQFQHCGPENPGLIPRLGFGGADIALAWGDELDAPGGILDLRDWTVVNAPDHSPTLDVEIPAVRDWPADQWFITYDATDPAAVAVGLFGIHEDLGLYADTALTSDWENLCDIARDVLAFDEFVAGIEPDRERWDLPDGEDGDEQIIVDTLIALRDDEATREKFFEWTPCTYKLCVLTGGVPPRIG